MHEYTHDSDSEKQRIKNDEEFMFILVNKYLACVMLKHKISFVKCLKNM